MKTKLYGEQQNTVVIEREGRDTIEIQAADATVKLWFSDGTVLGIKYGKYSMLYPRIWQVKVLAQGHASFVYTQCTRETLLNYSDVYETDAELLEYEVILRNSFDE
jgi:hypothetical protein